MKNLFSALLLYSLCSPAMASIIVYLDEKTISFMPNPKETIYIKDGDTLIRITDPEASYPTDGDLLSKYKKRDLTDAEFTYYTEQHAKKAKQWKNFDYSKLPRNYTCFSGALDNEVPSEHECKDAMAKLRCGRLSHAPYFFEEKLYPVDGETRISMWLRQLKPASKSSMYGRKVPASCEQTELKIGCRSGRCWGVPSSGEYGFYPGRWNSISIDGRKWGFVDSLSRQQELEVWQSIRDGSRFAYQLIHWPYEGQVTGSQTISLPKGLKDKIYQTSLKKP